MVCRKTSKHGHFFSVFKFSKGSFKDFGSKGSGGPVGFDFSFFIEEVCIRLLAISVVDQSSFQVFEMCVTNLTIKEVNCSYFLVARKSVPLLVSLAVLWGRK